MYLFILFFFLEPKIKKEGVIYESNWFRSGLLSLLDLTHLVGFYSSVLELMNNLQAAIDSI